MTDQNEFRTDFRVGPTLHVGCPNVGDRQLFDELVGEMFQRRWFTNGGELVNQFEQRLCGHLGVKHCIAVCNATTGLQLACRGMDLTGEVIMPAFTFIASPHAFSWNGLTPVFADVDLKTHCLCPDSVRSLVNENTSAILGVHLWGNSCEIESLQAIAAEYNLKLLFDAAHAFHCDHNGIRIGNFGNCEVFSFHATKFFNTFEGGAIATNDDQLATRVRKMQNFGFSDNGQIGDLGTNAKMPEVCAAMGLSMFDSIGQIATHNKSNAQMYRSLLHSVPGIRVHSSNAVNQSNWQYVVVEIVESQFGCSRDELHSRLVQNKILAKRYFHPGCHKATPYRKKFEASGRQLFNTDKLCQQVLCLPTGNAIGHAEVNEVCHTISRISRETNRRQPSLTSQNIQPPRKAAG
jgi:dTDP-4-amino-4,6-dideoxygalactose transaminase